MSALSGSENGYWEPLQELTTHEGIGPMPGWHIDEPPLCQDPVHSSQPTSPETLNSGYLGYLGPLALYEQKQRWQLGVLQVQDTPQGTEPTPGSDTDDPHFSPDSVHMSQPGGLHPQRSKTWDISGTRDCLSCSSRSKNGDWECRTPLRAQDPHLAGKQISHRSAQILCAGPSLATCIHRNFKFEISQVPWATCPV